MDGQISTILVIKAYSYFFLEYKSKLFFFKFFRLGEEQPEFVQAVADKKPAFSRMITKAAVVIYGLPSLNYTTTTQNSVNK